MHLSEPPFSRSKPTYQEVVQGATASMRVKPEGSPEPTLQWFRNGFVIPGFTKPELTFDSVNKSHEGTYTCELRNIAGSFVWQEAALTVKLPKTT